MKYFIGTFLIVFLRLNLYSAVWTERTHSDFADGKEYYYTEGDVQNTWDASKLKKYNLGSRVYSPAEGGLRIIGQDWDLDDNGWQDAVLASTTSGGNAIIYWNGSSGFDILNKTLLKIRGNDPQGASLCDLNRDGKLEILVGERDQYLAYIFDGASFIKCDSVKVAWGNQDIYPADLNNDGEIDIITPSSYWTYIYYGPGPFYTKKPIDSLYIPDAAPGSAHRTTVADLNYDGYLDIIMSCQASKVYVFWGSASGWKTQTILNCTYNWDHSIADLNKDGYLDIFVTTHTNNGTIFYGSASGFLSTGSTPGNGTGDCSIIDINADGDLDIIANSTNGTSYILFGPSYSSYTNLPISSGCGTEVADFDNDGDIDVLFGGLSGQSYLYWNNGGFLSGNKFTFPVYCNDALFEDLGNLWDRSNKERYLSNIFNAQGFVSIDCVRWWANITGDMDLHIWIRGTTDTTNWGDWVEASNGGALTDVSLKNKDFFQYKVCIDKDYKNTSAFSLDSVQVQYDGGSVTSCELRVSDKSGTTGSKANPVEIQLNDSMPVGGVQFTLSFDKNKLTADSAIKCSRASNMSISYNKWADSIKVIMFSASGDSIMPGTGSIAKIFFDVNDNAVIGDKGLMHAKNVAVASPLASPIPCTVFDGWFYFTGACTLQVANKQGIPGSSDNPMDIQLKNISSSIGGVQFTLKFASNLLVADTVVKNSRASSMNISYQKWADSLKVVIFSASGDSILPGTGSIAQVLFTAKNNVLVGDSASVTLNNVVLSTPGATPVSCLPINGWFKFYGMKGDINGDSAINVTDLVRCVNIVLGKSPVPGAYESWAANMNSDGAVNVVDIVALVNKILGRTFICATTLANELTPVNIGQTITSKNSDLTIPIEVSNSLPIAGVQAVIKYNPLAVSLGEAKNTGRSEGFEIASNVASDEMTIVLYSISGNTIKDGKGAIINIPAKVLSSDKNMKIELKEILLVAGDGSLIKTKWTASNNSGPKTYEITRNYPIPFSNKTEICYQIPNDSKVSLQIYNNAGQLVKSLVNENQTSGYYKATWDGKDKQGNSMVAGIYFCKMEARTGNDKFNFTKKLVLVR